MTPAATMPPIIHSRPLDGDTAVSVLAEAVRRRVPVQLYPQDSNDTILRRGAIRSSDAHGMVIEPIERSTGFPPLWRGTPVQATFCVADRAYSFQSVVVNSESGDRLGSVRVQNPETIAVIERRRSPRRRLHESTPVEIHVPTAEGELRIQASLMNASERGLACRVPARQAVRLSEGQFLWIHFQIPPSDDTFHLDGQAVSITRGTPDHAVLGVQFLNGDKWNACMERLREALATAGSKVLETAVKT